MNKKIKIIELLNKIANREEVPKKIIFLNETLEYDIDCQDYTGFSKTGSGAFFGYLFTNEPTQNFINDEVEILENNTKEIEELKYDVVDELVKAVNSIRKELINMEELKNIEKAMNDFFKFSDNFIKDCKEKLDFCEVEKRGCKGCYYDK
jgi:hypothetical protein